MLEWAAEHEPALLTPSARLLARAGLRPPPSGVKEARATLRAHGLLPDPAQAALAAARRRRRAARAPAARAPAPARASAPEPAVAARGVWQELDGGRAILRAVDLALAPGERVALMGRNGAGKSTLLRHLAGLQQPTRGSVTSTGRVALLMQNPGDYLLRERVGDEAPPAALERAGLAGLEDRHPRDLSGGERQRLALAIVLGGGTPPAALLLDEPTRGMDRAAKGTLVSRLRELSGAGVAVLVATHDAEFAAALGRARRAARRRPPDRGRARRGGPRGRLALRDRDRARARRGRARRRRPHARAGRRPAARADDRGGGRR